jgi:hypothetical protein
MRSVARFTRLKTAGGFVAFDTIEKQKTAANERRSTQMKKLRK